MPNPEIRIFPGLEELSLAAAERFEEVVRARTGEGKILTAALSGGSTPRRLYELLASAPFAGRIPWAQAHLFQVDERCVPPQHPESNFRMIREALLARVPVPRGSFHRIPAEDEDRERSARRYALEIAQVLQPSEGEWPRLELVFLGMGPDGHTASLFPGSPAIEEKNLWVRPNYVEKLGAYRITLTFPVLNAAKEIIFLVAGAEKAETLHRVLESPPAPEQFPAQGINPVDGQVSWYVDDAAARLLARKTGSTA